MKMFRTFTACRLLVLLFLLPLASCQHELGFENTISATGNALFTYHTADDGSCSGVILSGIYTSDSALTGSNTAKIQVNVSVAGTYVIGTAVVNGVSFTASGRFTTTGIQTVILVGKGVPVTAGRQSFPLVAGSSHCSFDIVFTAPAGPAVFTLAGALNACGTPVINGNYVAGVSLSAANTVVIHVNVLTAGAFSITTNTINGVRFSASGIFAGTGDLPVTLVGAGTPAAAGTSIFTPAIGANTCGFSILFTTAPAPTGTLTCKVDGIFNTFNQSAGASTQDPMGGLYLGLSGYTVTPNNSHEQQLEIYVSNNTGRQVLPGTYNEKGFMSASTGYRIEVDLHIINADLSTTIWNTSSSLITSNPPFTIIVSSISDGRAKGSFSGQLTNIFEGNTGKKTITEGVFDLPLQ